MAVAQDGVVRLQEAQGDLTLVVTSHSVVMAGLDPAIHAFSA
jgi:hypothetical protein